MINFPEPLENKLLKRKSNNELRILASSDTSFIDFYSNDYLGLSRDFTTKSMLSNGSTGSRLLSGTHSVHLALERKIADFHEAEAALVFNSGYDANIGFFSCVPQKSDLVLYDQYIHASIRDGLQIGNAKTSSFKHNDFDHLEKKILRYRSQFKTIYVVVESIYSMDGDFLDVKKLKQLVECYGVYLIVDEAHSFGWLGDNGAGFCYTNELIPYCFARLYTYGKAFGKHGASWVGSQQLIDYLCNFSRAFIYTTAMSPHDADLLLQGYDQLSVQELLRETLQGRIAYFCQQIGVFHLEEYCSQNKGPIQVFKGTNKESIIQKSNSLAEKKILIKPILSPTVPVGSERLRITLHSYNTNEEIDELINMLGAS